MTEEEFKALLKIEGKELWVESMQDSHGGVRYQVNIVNGDTVACGAAWYKCRDTAISHAIRNYYD